MRFWLCLSLIASLFISGCYVRGRARVSVAGPSVAVDQRGSAQGVAVRGYSAEAPQGPESYAASSSLLVATFGAHAQAQGWWVTTPHGQVSPTYTTDEASCVSVHPGYLSGDGWISVDPSGCGSLGFGDYIFWTDFNLEVPADLVLGVGFDNRLVDVRINNISLSMSSLDQDGYQPNSQVAMVPAQYLRSGGNRLEVVVRELGGSQSGVDNNTGVWANLQYR